MPNHAPFIYIIGPLHGKTFDEVVDNVNEADRAAFMLQRIAHEMGIAVITYAPHLQTGKWLIEGSPEMRKEIRDNEKLYMEALISLLIHNKPNAVYVLGDSPNSDIEQSIARVTGIKRLDSEESAHLFLLEWRDS